ncbi:unnamed protein product [Arctia plantaginis]|uniref:Hexosyltransferase n=1 Tax=Arctia plantaginis TaxID=874455 RepID=A0A8S0ZUW2_ARCPL|nr:unnamed protein product [Arctia plantaginis]
MEKNRVIHMDDDKHCYDDDRLYSSGRDSDDSPILSNRYERYRRYTPYAAPKMEEREKRSTLTVLAKFFLFCTAMILFCVLMYIPVYNKASDQLTKESGDLDNLNDTSVRNKRDISSFRQLLPELAKALQNNLVKDKTENVPEKRFEDDDNSMLPEFDMNQELGDHTEIPNYDYYDSNVMKIPPNGYEDNIDLEKVLNLLRRDNTLKENLPKVKEDLEDGNTEPEYKVVFLLGLPSNNNDTTIQNKILEESEKYGDIIQEGFIDSYNNLTLKSIMMLKWITNNCNDSVRYILKTDDDMYINVPNLIENLRNRSKEFDKRTKGKKEKEYMLIGDLICGARPVLDSTNKWYSPRYMYGGRVYPKYLSGTGYALSAHTARALYEAALKTNYFHLEDIFITGMCASRARPRMVPRDDPTFSYQAAGGAARAACGAHARATAHRVPPDSMRHLHRMLSKKHVLDT